MNNPALVQKKESTKSTLTSLKEKLAQMSHKEGALLLFNWTSQTIDLINADQLSPKAERFAALFKVMRLIEKKYPEVFELEDPVRNEGQKIQKLLVRFLKMREDRWSLDFKKIAETENSFKKLNAWDFKKTLEEWARKNVYLEDHEKETVLNAAFSVDVEGNLSCIQKWWNPQEEIDEKHLFFSARHAVNGKYLKLFADVLNKNASATRTVDEFYEQASLHAWSGFVQTGMDYQQSSLAYILQNTGAELPPSKTQITFGATLYVLANNLEAWSMIKNEDLKKISQDILLGAARIDYQEAQHAIEEIFYYVKKDGGHQLDLVPYVLEKQGVSQAVDFMLGKELSGYFDENDLNKVGTQKLLEYVQKIKNKSPSLFYFISSACEDTELEKISALAKALNASPEHAKDWKEKLGIDLKAKDLSQWSARIVEMMDTNYLDEERVSLIFEELHYLNQENNVVCSWMNSIFEQQEEIAELSEKIQDEPLEKKDKEEIAKALTTIGRPDLGEAFKSLMLNHDLQRGVKKVKAPKKINNEMTPHRF